MPFLALVNGAPGSGKSTAAEALAEQTEMMLALDVDGLKHALGRWQEHPTESGLHARRLCLAVADAHLGAGHDVVVGQYVARTAFLDQLASLAGRRQVPFHEVVLHVDEATLSARLAQRLRDPQRPEHHVNNALVGPDDAGRLVESIEALRPLRPDAVWVDAGGSLSETVEQLRAVIGRALPSDDRQG